MIALLQRVTEGRVEVNGAVVGQIGAGLLVLLAVERMDTGTQADRMVDRLLGYRVFEDPAGRMNLSLVDTGGSLLLVPQFTLAADTTKGMRPSFTAAAAPDLGLSLFDHVVRRARATLGDRVATGRFGANMQVSLTNDGPVTFWLRNAVEVAGA
ncbi:MAG: D-aminoacyl-tRNA deacylase [Steroidobacteraceae bacterium]|nr:D-aminoacyl-tRNA deacylase [Steroidobacteraceae bacterium]